MAAVTIHDDHPSDVAAANVILRAQLADSERLLSELQRLGKVGLWELDLVTNEVTWSDEMYRVFGAADDIELKFDTIMTRIHPEDVDRLDLAVQQATRDGLPYGLDVRTIADDGSTRWIHARGRSRTDESGEVVGLVGTSTDVTDRYRTDQRLRRFVADASHELRTPVASIWAAIELLVSVRDDAEADSRERSLLDILERQGARLRDLTNDLLDLLAIETQTRTVKLTVVPLRPMINELRSGLIFDDELIVATIPDVAVVADRHALMKALAHLVTNARIHGGPTVTLAVRASDHEVAVSVSDDGTGVPDTIVDDMYVPFSRSTGSNAPGSGLGLAVVKQLVDTMGARIQHRPGPGTTFTIHLERDHSGGAA